MARFRTAAVLGALLAAWLVPPQAGAANAFAQIAHSLALIGALDAKGDVSSVGTAFCVYSANGVSFFVTNNHVVTDDYGRPERALIAILGRDMPGDPKRYRATIVRRSEDPDLAIVQVQGVQVDPVHVSAAFPNVGDDVAIAGFPYTESVLWGGLFGGKHMHIDRTFPAELVPSEHKGTVSAIHGGGYYIQYDALTDSGNSGGPLFDPQTGEVFGVVQASLEGAPEYKGMPSTIHNNLAISVHEGWDLISAAPVHLDTSNVAIAGAEHFAGANPRCGHILGQRAYASSVIATLRAHVNDAKYRGRRKAMAATIAGYEKTLARLSRKPCA